MISCILSRRFLFTCDLNVMEHCFSKVSSQTWFQFQADKTNQYIKRHLIERRPATSSRVGENSVTKVKWHRSSSLQSISTSVDHCWPDLWVQSRKGCWRGAAATSSSWSKQQNPVPASTWAQSQYLSWNTENWILGSIWILLHSTQSWYRVQFTCSLKERVLLPHGQQNFSVYLTAGEIHLFNW